MSIFVRGDSVMIINPCNGILNIIKQQNNNSSSTVVIGKIYKLVSSFYIESDEHEWSGGQYQVIINLVCYNTQI